MILIYLLKVSACTAIFFATYQLLLSRLTFFKLNRTYLLFALVASFVIPALTVENKHEVILNEKPTELKVAYSRDNTFEEAINQNGNTSASFTSWKQTLEYVYYVVLIAFLMKTMFTIAYIKYVLYKFKISKFGSLIFVKQDSKIKNCSFLNQIVVDASLQKEEQELVIQHELIHVNQAHGFDKILVNVAVCVLWFNPIIYFWRIRIDNNHEFLADQGTSNAADKKTYAALLLSLASPAHNFATNNFSKLPLKKRIMMMYKRPNNPIKKLTYLVVVPVISFCCVAFINKKDVIIEKKILAHSEIKHQQKLLINNDFKNTLQAIKEDSTAKPKDTLVPVDNENQLGAVNVAVNLTDESKASNLSINAEVKALETGRELILVIDPGHGGKDGVAVSAGGIKEKDLNLKAAQILKEEAEKRKIKVVLTRNKDKMIPLQYRLPDENATAFISIHHNSTPLPNVKPKFEGIEVIVSRSNPNIKMAEKFGISLLSSLNQLEGIEVSDSLKNANLLLTRESKIPAVVIELGNISSEKSLAYVSDEANLRKIGNLILDGFLQFAKSAY